MARLKALRDTPGSIINRDDLGIVRKGDEFDASNNDAQYLEREGYAERVAEAAPIATDTPAATPTTDDAAGSAEETTVESTPAETPTGDATAAPAEPT